jgi:putative FmdB family regulatory protein
MPLFEFKCPKCGEQWEDLVDRKVETLGCPVCTTPSPKVFATGIRVVWNKPPPTWSGGKEPRKGG